MKICHRLSLHGRNYSSLIVRLFCLASLVTSCQRCSTAEEDLRIGVSPWPPIEYLFLAQEKGLFEQLGVKVKIIEYSAIQDARRAFERGQIDVMGVTPLDVLLAGQYSKRQLQVFAVMDTSHGADVLIAHSSIKSLSDLKGKEVGAELATVSFYLLSRAVESHSSVSLQDMTVVPLSQGHMGSALRNGKIDAASTFPPYSFKLLSDPDFHMLFSSKQIPDEIVDAFAADKDLIDRRRDELARFLLGFFKAQQYAEQHPEESYAFMAAREHIPSAEFKESLGLVKMVSLNEQLAFLGPDGTIEATFQRMENMLRGLGHLSKPQEDYKGWTDSIVKKALPMHEDKTSHDPD